MAFETDLDTRGLLETLTRHGVDFVIVGGIAAVLHGSARVTHDLDVCCATDAGNLHALGDALMALRARLAGVDEALPFVPDADTLRRIELLTLDTDAGRLDVMTRPDGAPRYATLRRRAERFDVGGFVALVASLDDMIEMKLAAGRLKDLADVEELQAIARLRRRA